MITVKEEFLTEEKTKLAIKKGGYEAVVMWLAIKGYVARKNSNGFVPDEAIDELPGAPKSPRKALDALVSCKLTREDGTLGAGLVDKVNHGWKLHDYEDHGTIKEVEDERRRKAKDQKANKRAQLKRLADERAVRELSADNTGQPPDTVRGLLTTGAPDSLPDSPADAPRSGTHASAPARGSQPSPAQPEERESPNPRKTSGQRCAESLTAPAPAQRLDVLRVHDAWKRSFGRMGAAFRNPFDEDAYRIAEAIGAHSEADCLLVARYAPDDDKVSGRTDEMGAKHESVKYIFGNEDAFSRILRMAQKREAGRSGETAAERIERLKKQPAGAA